MGNLVLKGRGSSEEEKFRQYVKQLKEECAGRLMMMLYHPQYGTMDLKFWLAFAKKKFLKLTMWVSEWVKEEEKLIAFTYHNNINLDIILKSIIN